MKPPSMIAVLALGSAALALAPLAHGATYQLPSVATPTIQAAVNAAAVEPFAYHAVVDVQVHVATSHNGAFSSLANAEVVGDDLRISGLGGVGGRRLPRADAGAPGCSPTA